MNKEIKMILNDRESKFDKNYKAFGVFFTIGDIRKVKEYIEKLEIFVERIPENEKVLLELHEQGFKYLARDLCGTLTAFKCKPFKLEHAYIYDWLYFDMDKKREHKDISNYGHLFPTICPEDKVPFNIEAYLEGLKYLRGE